MQVILLRHGMTPGNALRRYIGSTDEPLSAAGMEAAREKGAAPDVHSVFVTPLLRTQQTAHLLFPNAAQTVVSDLREMDFGVFENRSAAEMEHNAAYRAWVGGGCIDRCPDGESVAGFTSRVCAAFAQTVQALPKDAQKAFFVVHGGTIMALLSGFARPAVSYYDVLVKNCCGYVCTLGPGEDALPLTLCGIRYVQSISEAMA